MQEIKVCNQIVQYFLIFCNVQYCVSTTVSFVWLCACVYVYVIYEDTNLYNDMIWHRYYNMKVIYEDTFCVPVIIGVRQ